VLANACLASCIAAASAEQVDAERPPKDQHANSNGDEAAARSLPQILALRYASACSLQPQRVCLQPLATLALFERMWLHMCLNRPSFKTLLPEIQRPHTL
jgi:hypothetical protein